MPISCIDELVAVSEFESVQQLGVPGELLANLLLPMSYVQLQVNN